MTHLQVVTISGFENRVKKAIRKIRQAYPALAAVQFAVAGLDQVYPEYESDLLELEQLERFLFLQDARFIPDLPGQTLKLLIHSRFMDLEPLEQAGLFMLEMGRYFSAESVKPLWQPAQSLYYRDSGISQPELMNVVNGLNIAHYFLSRIIDIPFHISAMDWLADQNVELARVFSRDLAMMLLEITNGLVGSDKTRAEVVFDLPQLIHCALLYKSIVAFTPSLSGAADDALCQDVERVINQVAASRQLDHTLLVSRYSDLGLYLLGESFAWSDLIRELPAFLADYSAVFLPYFPSDLHDKIKNHFSI